MTTQFSQKGLFVEAYSILPPALPLLFAWRISASIQETTSIGWKVAYHFKRMLGGHWIYASERIITDLKISDIQMENALNTLWNSNTKSFSDVRSLILDSNWQPSIQTQADFVALGLASDLEGQIRSTLLKYEQKLRNAYVERDYAIQGWDIRGIPAISISVFSHLISSISLRDYAASLHSPNELLGLMVKDRLGSYKGEITEIVGTVGSMRDTLGKRTTRESMKRLIENAPANDLVVKVEALHNTGYDYVASALQIVVRNQDFSRLDIEGDTALATLQIDPNRRFNMVEGIAAIFRAQNLIAAAAYHEITNPGHFFQPDSVEQIPMAILGDSYRCVCEPRVVLNALRHHPPYKRAAQFFDNSPIQIGIINFIGDKLQIKQYINTIRQRLLSYSFNVTFTGAQRPDPRSQYDIERAVDSLSKSDILLVFMPGAAKEDDIDDSLYNRFKAVAITQGIQSQVIYETTLTAEYAFDNILLGILGKTGNIPYVLAEPLSYTDAIAGIDIARERTRRRSGSVNVAAVTRLYTNNGDFVRYFLHDAPIEGETLPRNIIRRLFLAQYFAQKRVVIHRDGLFRGNERKELQNWADEIGSQFFLVEVIKSGAPRLYFKNNDIQKPPKGTAFLVNEHESFLVTSQAHKRSTPRPLTIRTDGVLPIEQAVHSVYVLTMLHFGSTLPPRLPVTIHYSDKIGYLVLRGIKPRQLEGSIPFWL